MKKTSAFREPVAAVLTDHKLLAEYEAHVREISGSNGRDSARRAARALRHLLNYKVVSHFAYEEEHIFPGLLQANGTHRTVRLLSKLQDEHRALQAQADRLDALLGAATTGQPAAQRLRADLQAFFTNLQKHAQVENKVFPSLL